MTNINHLLDRAIGELTDHNPDIDRVLGLIVRARFTEPEPPPQSSLDQDFVRASNDDLPPMQPVKAKKWRSSDVACPSCGAKKGKPCFRMDRRGRGATPTDQPLVDGRGGAQWHAARTKAAKEAAS